MPLEAFRLTADLMAGTGGPLGAVFARSPRRTVRGLRLVARDLEWSHGEGPEVDGSAEALLLAITGRPVEPGELTGPGASVILARISNGTAADAHTPTSALAPKLQLLCQRQGWCVTVGGTTVGSVTAGSAIGHERMRHPAGA